MIGFCKTTVYNPLAAGSGGASSASARGPKQAKSLSLARCFPEVSIQAAARLRDAAQERWSAYE
jgi:hypothetical protein